MMNWQFQNLYGHPSARLSRFYSYEVEVAPHPTRAKGDKEETEGSEGEGNGDGQSQVGSRRSKPKSKSKTRFLPDPSGLRAKWATFFHACMAILLRICCVLLFDAPAAHNNALETVWVDKIVNKVRFQQLIDRTTKDWGDVSLLSTVLWT